jgi:hypothetical protein
MNVPVFKDWFKSLSITNLYVAAKIHSDGSSIYCPDYRKHTCSKIERKTDPTVVVLDDFDHSVKLGVPAGTKGKVSFSLTIEYKGGDKPPHWSKVPQESVSILPFDLPFECTPEGDCKFLKKAGTRSGQFPNRNLSVDIDFYHKRENPSDTSLPGIPDAIWKEWMKKLGILKIVIIARLTMSENGPASESFTIKDESVAVPSIGAGSTGEFTAILGPVTIELEPVGVAPPLTVPGGVRYHVYFDRDSSELDKVVKGSNEAPKHQGNAFSAWVREEITQNGT